jgi:hypothetical protein
VQLAVAEVEIYSLPYRTLTHYEGQSPVPTTQSWQPILPEESISTVFTNTHTEGAWTLQLTDSRKRSKQVDYSDISDGGISGWSLTLHDYFGTARTYSTDVAMTIETLPRYGTLRIAAGSTTTTTTSTSDSDSNGNDSVLRASGGFALHEGICRGSGDGSNASTSAR